LAEARQIILNYGSEMPSTPVTKLLRLGSITGTPGWWTICRALYIREWLKNQSLTLKSIAQQA